MIVTRPPVDYPRSIVAATSIFSALTWAGDWWGFSPACLLPNQDSGGQARLLMAGGVLAPCLVMLASMAAWAVRCVRDDPGLACLCRTHSVCMTHKGTCLATIGPS